MTPPMTPTAERLYGALGPVATEDEALGWPLATYCQALAKTLDEVADLSADVDDETPGWSVLLDPDRVPAKFLPWLGQFLGVQVPTSLPEAAQRLRIRETDGFRRGTPDALKGAARQYLTGAGTVFLTERHGSPYRVTVTTYEAETPVSDWLVTENLVANPSAESGLTGWTKVGGGSMALVTTDAAPGCGSSCVELTSDGSQWAVGVSVPDLPVVPGDVLHMGAWVRTPDAVSGADYLDFTIGWKDGAAAWFGGIDLYPHPILPGWAWAQASAVAPAGTVTADPSFMFGVDVGNVPAGAKFRIDGLFVSVNGKTPQGYGDGDTAGWKWNGTPHASTSEPIPTTIILDALLEQKPAGLVLAHSVVPGGDFDTLRDTHSDFADVTATFATFDELRADPAAQ